MNSGFALLFVLGFFATANAQPNPLSNFPVSCPAGWTTGNNGRCYFMGGVNHGTTNLNSQYATDNFRARLICWTMNARLAFIRDVIDYNAVSAINQATTNLGGSGFWIDGTAIAEPQICWRTSEGHPFYLNWNGGEPNNDGNQENCVQFLSNNLYNDLTCLNNLPFLCEKL